MPQARVLDPGSSLLAFFGAELRRRRVAAGMSQDQLGQAINFSAALVGRVEVGERMPSPDLARRCDDVLATGGLFAHLRESMDSDMHAYPAWFREFVEREREAASIREFNALAIPGLLQTEDYARELFRAGRPADSDEEISQHVAARLERQRILDRAKPPMLWAVVDEGVLRRQVGGPACSATNWPIWPNSVGTPASFCRSCRSQRERTPDYKASSYCLVSLTGAT